MVAEIADRGDAECECGVRLAGADEHSPVRAQFLSETIVVRTGEGLWLADYGSLTAATGMAPIVSLIERFT